MTQRTPRIDVHAHMMEREAAAAGVPHSVVTAFGARKMPPAAPGSAQEMAERAGFDPATHIEMLDRLGLDAEVVSNMTVMQGTSWAEPAVEDEINTRVNDEIARWVSEHPTRIVGSFTLPLQSHDASVRELDRCTGELGMRVLQIPAAVHGTNLAWHAATAVLLFAVCRRLTGARWRSFLVAAVFALHPLRVESVAWAAERKDVLSVFFGVLTLWAYARYVDRPVGASADVDAAASRGHGQ